MNMWGGDPSPLIKQMSIKYLELKCIYCNRQNTDVKFDDEDDYPTFACEFCGEENEIVQGFYTRAT